MAEKVNLELEVEAAKAIKEVEDLRKEFKELNELVEKSNAINEQGFDALKKTGESSAKGIKAIGSSIKAAGIGVFLIALQTMQDLFMQNQKVVDIVNTAFESLALVFNDVFGLLTGGVDSIKKVGEAFDKFFGKPIETAVASFQKFGSAFSKIFGGDFSGALDDAKKGFSGLGDAISQTGDGFVEAATDAADYVVNVKNAAVENVELAKSAELAEAKNVGLLEKFDRAAEKQRQIRDEERNSIEKRIEANEKLGEILEEQNKTMLENANIALKSAQANFDRNASIENEVALIQARNEVLAVEATVEGFRSEQKANDLALDKERIELKNTENEADTNRRLDQQKFEAEQELTETQRLQRLIEINQQEKLIQEERLQGIINEANLGTQARIDAEGALKDFTQANNQELITLQKQQAANILAVEKKALADKQKLEAQKIQATLVSLSAVASLVDQDSKAGKAIAVAQGLINTYLGVTQALASSPPPFNFIAAAATAAAGFKAVADIKRTRLPSAEASSPSSGSTTGSFSVSAPAEATPPSFNIVGATATNQIANLLSNQEPIKAFVVSQDVTTAQSLERNIVEGSSI